MVGELIKGENMFSIEQMQSQMGKIHSMDCLEFMRQVPDDYFDLVLTDPPYNIGIDGGKGWDTIDNYEDFIKIVFSEFKRISKRQLIFFDYKYTKLFEELEAPFERFIWHREGGFAGNWIKKGYEPFYVYGDIKNVPKIKNDYAKTDKRLKEEKSISNVWSIANIVGLKNESVAHPTQKPISLIKQALLMMANNNDKIFDPFAGSCTTCVAAEALGLAWCACELEPDYVEIGNQRLKLVQADLFGV
jgi:DNA modification methylase